MTRKLSVEQFHDKVRSKLIFTDFIEEILNLLIKWFGEVYWVILVFDIGYITILKIFLFLFLLL